MPSKFSGTTLRSEIYKTDKMSVRSIRMMKPVLLTAVAATMLASCSSPKKLAKNLEKMNLRSETEALEVQGDSIKILVKGKIPAKTFNKKAIVKFSPVLRYGDPELDQTVELKPLYLQGEKVRTKKEQGDATKRTDVKVIKYAKGGSFQYEEKIEFTPAMKKSRLSMDYQIKIASKYSELDQCIVGKRDSANRGTITTALLVRPLDDILYYSGDNMMEKDADEGGGGTTGAGGDIVKRKKGIPDLTFYYVIDESSLRDSVRRGYAMRKLTSTLATVAPMKGKKANDGTMPTVTLKGVTFLSYASPDGEINHNGDLCKGRARSAANAVKKEMKRMGIMQAYDKSMFENPDNNREDWAGFTRLVQASNMSGKNEVLAVVNSTMPLEDKEKSLRALPSWNELKRGILPRLRRTEVYFDGVGKEGMQKRPIRTAEEIKNDYKTMGQEANLSQREMLILANSMDDMTERERIYKAYMEKYPEDVAGKSNYYAIRLKSASQSITDYRVAMASTPAIDESNAALEQLSAQYPNNDTIKNNLAVAKRFKRKYNDSRDLMMMAQGKGIAQNNNMGILNIKYGNYQDAVSSFKADQCDYNVALALTLNKEYDKALDKLRCMTDKGNSGYETFYLRSIIYARLNNKSEMATSLTRAVQEAKKVNKAQEVAEMANKDLEFMKFFESPEFKNALRDAR